jgi:hypothetical protein
MYRDNGTAPTFCNSEVLDLGTHSHILTMFVGCGVSAGVAVLLPLKLLPQNACSPSLVL